MIYLLIVLVVLLVVIREARKAPEGWECPGCGYEVVEPGPCPFCGFKREEI